MDGSCERVSIDRSRNSSSQGGYGNLDTASSLPPTYTPPLNSMQAMPWLFKIWPGSEQLLSKVLPTNRLLPKGVQGRVGARDENDGDGGLNDDEENVTKVIFGLGTE